MYPLTDAKERVAYIQKGMQKVMPEVLRQIEVYRANRKKRSGAKPQGKNG